MSRKIIDSKPGALHVLPHGWKFRQRNTPATETNRRNSDVRPDSLDTSRRRVRSVLTSEDPALVYDWMTGQVILEILLADGCKYEDQTPLIRDHNQYSVTSIVGSVTDHEVERDAIMGWLSFGEELDEEAESIWKRVAQGHLRKVSVGYNYTAADYTTIAKGQSAVIAGRTFTAPEDRALRVVSRWVLHEVSLVVIPADPRAQMRENPASGTAKTGIQESSAHENDLAPTSQRGNELHEFNSEDAMKKFLQFLHKHGLAKSVTSETEALQWAAKGNLTAEQLSELADLCKADNVAFDSSKSKAKVEASQIDPPADPQPGTRSNLPADGPSAAEAAQEAVVQERQRVSAIRTLAAEHDYIDDELVNSAIDDGWDIDRTRTAFLNNLRDSRQQGAPAIHSRSSSDVNLQVMQAALLEREGLTPDSEIFNDRLSESVTRRSEFNAGWMRAARSNDQAQRDQFEQAFDVVGQRGLRDASLMRIAETIAEIETGQRMYSDQDVLDHIFGNGQRSQSSGAYSTVYGSVIHLVMLESYRATAATYEQFCQVVEVGDFREHKTADMGAVGRLRKQGKNDGDAPILNVDDPVLNSIMAERYAGQLQLNDQMLINDTLGVAGFLPAELGETCRQMPIDLAFAEILNTGNLADGRARYNTTDGNSVDVAAFDESGLTTLGTALKAKKVGDRRIAINTGVLVAGTTLSPVCRKQMNSETINEANNPHAGTYRVVEDTAIDLGVSDPANDDADIAGTPNSIYAFTGVTNKAPVKVAFRRGTNRGPVIRSGMLSKGQWGVYWDVYMDVGAAFQRRTGTVKVNVTG